MAVAISACDGNEEGATFTELGTVEQAIYYGTRSPSVTNLTAGEELAIGFLADSSGSPFCTATLIDRDVAITARHCVEDTYRVDDMRFGIGDPGNPEALIRVHSAPYPNDRDVALLLLMEDAVSQVPGVEPIPFNRTAPPQSLVGTDIEAAGYGATHDDSTGKYYVTVQLTEIQSEWLVVNGFGEQGICFGDSGGPLFIHVDDGSPVIAGVESHGDSSCVDQDFETRLDQAADWIDGQMLSFDPDSEPTTGTQGDSDDEWCIPVGSGLWSVEDGESKCGAGEVRICSASPATAAPSLWVTMAGGLLVLFGLRRRRAATCDL
jgi:MYXO-CTERM domain-containing protein